jgi:hypothetical protein
MPYVPVSLALSAILEQSAILDALDYVLLARRDHPAKLWRS